LHDEPFELAMRRIGLSSARYQFSNVRSKDLLSICSIDLDAFLDEKSLASRTQQ